MLDKIIPLIEDKTYNFEVLIDNSTKIFTKKGKEEVINFLIAFSNSIDLEQVYNVLKTPATDEVREVQETEQTESIVKKKIIKPKKIK